MSTTSTFRDRVADYFKARPGHWIDADRLMQLGGKCAWRTRLSECRLELGMVIRNRQRRQTDAQRAVGLYQNTPTSRQRNRSSSRC